ncbi:hypothetical protein N7507_005597 [Penicillium longicatenatum]|nr:hypothetical protein N7507_005597 [Penicillium longicatenatum]
MLQRFYTVRASDSPNSKAPRQESPSWSPNTSIAQALPVSVPKLGYNPETSQLTIPTGLGTRLREAWKSALPRRESSDAADKKSPQNPWPQQWVFVKESFTYREWMNMQSQQRNDGTVRRHIVVNGYILVILPR